MANNFSADFPDYWSSKMQTVFYRTNVSIKIADTSERATMKNGDVLNRPYRSSNNVQLYTRGTAVTIDDKTDTQESLTVNRQFATGFYMDNFDKIQSNYDLVASYAKDDGIYLSNQVDADVLGEVLNAASVVDDADFGGTSGDGLSLNSTNVLSVIATAKRKLQKQNVPMEELVGVISPEFEQALIEYGAGRDTNMGDSANENGYITSFYGFKLYRSNQLTGTAVLSTVTNPTNNDTVTILGQVFTFVSSIGTTAGNVLIGANADATRVNLAALINAPWTTTANGVALTGNNLRLFQARVSAVDSPSGDTTTVTYKGAGVLTVSSTLTATADGWTAAKQIQHNYFGVQGNPVLVMQAESMPQQNKVPDKNGYNILNFTLYGVKSFVDNTKQMVNVKIRSNTY